MSEAPHVVYPTLFCAQESERGDVEGRRPENTVGYDPFIKCQLASHNELESLVWYKFGHVALKSKGDEPCVLHRAVLASASSRHSAGCYSGCRLIKHMLKIARRARSRRAKSLGLPMGLR